MSIQIKRIGHVGLLVSDFERSFRFYTEVLGCKVTNRTKRPDGSEGAFLRFDDMHHDFVIASAPPGVDVTSAGPRERLIQQIAFEVEDRDCFPAVRREPPRLRDCLSSGRRGRDRAKRARAADSADRLGGGGA